MIRIAFRDLQFRWLRTLITVFAVAAVFAVVLVMAGLSGQFRIEVRRAVEGFNADAWIVATGDGGPFTMTPTVPASLAEEYRDEDTRASPFISRIQVVKVGRDDRLARVVGHDPQGVGSPEVHTGHRVEAAGQMVVPVEADADVGDTIEIAKREFEVVGLTEHMTMAGGTPLLFIGLSEAQELYYNGQPHATGVVISGETPELADGFEALSNEQVWEDALRNLGGIMAGVDFLGVLLWIAGTALIGAVVYVSALERLRDFALMKALGGSTARVLGGVVVSSVIVAVLAAGVGAGLASAFSSELPFEVELTRRAYLLLLGLAVAGGLAASLGGVRHAAKADPALAFSAAG